MKRFAIALFAIIISCLTIKAQNITPYRGVAGEGYNFWLSTPASGDTVSAKPLVVFLHGSSLCGNDLNRVMRYGTMAAVKKGLNLDAYVVAPQNNGGSWKPARVMADIEWVEKHYNIDNVLKILDGFCEAQEGRMKLEMSEDIASGDVKHHYHHGRCDIGSPWACGTAFDVLEDSEE